MTQQTTLLERKIFTRVKVREWRVYLKPENWAEEIRDLPLMDDGELENLALSIAKNGLQHKVRLNGGKVEDGFYVGGKVSDGRDRLRAFTLPELEGQEPGFMADDASLTTWDVAIAETLERKDLREQRNALAEKLYSKFAEEGKKRRLANLKRGPQKPSKSQETPEGGATSPSGDHPARKKTAAATGTTGQHQQRKKKAEGESKPASKPDWSAKATGVLKRALRDLEEVSALSYHDLHDRVREKTRLNVRKQGFKLLIAWAKVLQRYKVIPADVDVEKEIKAALKPKEVK